MFTFVLCVENGTKHGHPIKVENLIHLDDLCSSNKYQISTLQVMNKGEAERSNMFINLVFKKLVKLIQKYKIPKVEFNVCDFLDSNYSNIILKKLSMLNNLNIRIKLTISTFGNVINLSLLKDIQLTSLFIMCDYLTENKIDILQSLLLSPNCKLYKLTLSSICTNLEERIKLIDIIKLNTTIRKLKLRKFIGFSSGVRSSYINLCESMYNMLKENKYIEYLDLLTNHFDEIIQSFILKGLIENKHIKILHIPFLWESNNTNQIIENNKCIEKLYIDFKGGYLLHFDSFIKSININQHMMFCEITNVGLVCDEEPNEKKYNISDRGIDMPLIISIDEIFRLNEAVYDALLTSNNFMLIGIFDETRNYRGQCEFLENETNDNCYHDNISSINYIIMELCFPSCHKLSIKDIHYYEILCAFNNIEQMKEKINIIYKWVKLGETNLPIEIRNLILLSLLTEYKSELYYERINKMLIQQ